MHPDGGSSGQEIAAWYVNTFGFRGKEGNSSIFVSSSGPGRIEVMKEGEADKPHIAIRVANFELACSILKGKGIELEEPKVSRNAKAVYLKGTDPAGNRIHLLWNRT